MEKLNINKNKIVLKASAGTGKTYRLSLEYLAALFSGENYKDIIVMTFTKKATAEIKERIIEFLEKINSNHKDKAELLKNIKEFYPELEISDEKIKKIAEELNQNVDRLKIYTIDGFINTIFKTTIAPYLGINSYNIIDEDENEEIFLKLFENIFKNKTSFNIFKNFLATNTEKNLDNYIETLKTLVSDRWKMILLDENKNLSEKKLLREDKNYDFVFLYEECMNIILEMATKKSGADIKLIDFLRKDYQSFELRENYFEKNLKIFFSEKDGVKDLPWNGIKLRESKSCSLEIEKENFYNKYEEFQISLAEYLHDTKIIQYEKDVLNFIEELYKHYDAIKLKDGKLSFADISNYTFMFFKEKNLNLFDENGITKYFKDIFDSNISTVFIDEFQDTSILQWKLLKEIVNSAEKVICVGDEKQSIYGWRGGEKKLFETLPKLLESTESSLNKSYRSSEAIVNFTNSLFNNMSKIYLDEHGEKFNDNWHFTNVVSYSEKPAHVSIIKSDDEDENVDKSENSNLSYEQICEILKTNFNNNYSGVAVIARSNADLEKMAGYLSDAQIPFILESNKNIFQHRVNIFVHKFIEYLIYDDYTLLLEFLRSDIVKLDTKKLKTLIMQKESVLEYLNFETKNNFEISVLEKIRNIRKKYLENNFSAQEIILEIFKTFNILEIYSSDSDIKNSYKLLEISKLFGNLNQLIQAANSNPNNSKFSQVASESENAVTLITVHKSKGLEYETVFYLYKSSRGNNGSLNLEFAINLDENYENVLNYLILNSNYEKVVRYLPEEFKYILMREGKKIQEEINVLYVGLTRAKTNLFIVLDKVSKNDNFKLALAYINFEDIGTSEIISPPILDEKNLTTNIEDNNLSVDFSQNILDTKENIKNLEKVYKNFTFDGDEKRIIGTAVHNYFENILYGEEQEKEFALKKVIADFGAEIGEEKLSEILKSSQVQEIFNKYSHLFSKSWDNIYSEYEIRLDGELKRIDRLMIKKYSGTSKGEILIADYKTGDTNETQLEGYKLAIENELKILGQLENYSVKTEFVVIEL